MTLSAYQIPDTLNDEINDLELLIKGYKNSTVSEAELKARRVPFGIYEQRKRGTYMVRIRCTAGIITPDQLQLVADLSLKFASGNLHVTTRQEIQIHDVLLEDIIGILRSLAEVGLSSRGGGGNTVRNITAPWDAGISKNELFDVTPYAVALTSELISRSDSWLLPRKYKIAFSNNSDIFSYAQVNDLGFIPVIKGDEKGFKVYVAGGMGRQSQPGHLLHEFVKASQIGLIAEAIKRLFSKFGNRKNKHAARLRFLWNSLGREQFIALYEHEKDLILKEKPIDLKIKEIVNEEQISVDIEKIINESVQYKTWKSRYVIEQKQADLYSIKIPLLYGNIRAEKIKILSFALKPFGENTIRFTQDQNVLLRNVPYKYLGNIFKVNHKVSELSGYASIFGNAIACAGASTCQLGICRSRGALDAIVDQLKISDIDLDLLSDVRIHISGCSNSCGQHIIADLGFYGKAGRKDQHSYPEYVIVGGTKSSPEGIHLAEKINQINARDLPQFVEALLQNYSENKQKYTSFASYLESEGNVFIGKKLTLKSGVPSFEENSSYYKDWGDTEIFSLAGKGTGECSAGLFDLIEIDLNKLRQIRASLAEEKNKHDVEEFFHDLIIVSARMLLITRGVEGNSDKDVLEKFRDHFLNKGLIENRFRGLIEIGINSDEKQHRWQSVGTDIIDLSKSIENLYRNMDNSMQFGVKQAEQTVLSGESTAHAAPKVTLSKDFRGIACPMNFVKTKMALSQINKGETLQVILDDGAPIENVPKSVEEEGHTILSTLKSENHWVVSIRKKQ